MRLIRTSPIEMIPQTAIQAVNVPITQRTKTVALILNNLFSVVLPLGVLPNRLTKLYTKPIEKSIVKTTKKIGF
jgi:hypothetical protein